MEMKRIEYYTVRYELQDWLGAGDSRSLDDAVHGECSTRSMQYVLNAVLSVSSTRCMQYSVYTVVGDNSWPWPSVIEWDDLTWSS